MAPISDLNTVIYLFSEALDRRPAQHPLRLDSCKDLAGALVARFSLTSQHQDLSQAMWLRAEILREWLNVIKKAEGELYVRICFAPVSIFVLTSP